jgi:hypothetical protein
MDIKPTTPSDELPCTCTSMDQYVDGLCPGCIEATDRAADLNDEEDESAVREGDDDRYYSGTGESMDDPSYERYLNRG